jgi:hypothetical protein
MSIPTISALGQLSAEELRQALVDIDDQLTALHFDESGELRSLTPDESKQFDLLTNTRARCESAPSGPPEF